MSQFLRIDFPNLLAYLRLVLSMGMLVLLMNLRPYVHDHTFWVDVTCHVSLTALFGLHIIATSREFLGVAESLDPTRLIVFSTVAILGTFFRWIYLIIIVLVALISLQNQISTRCSVCSCMVEGYNSFRKCVQNHPKALKSPGSKT
jgi:hypothetical protein